MSADTLTDSEAEVLREASRSLVLRPFGEPGGRVADRLAERGLLWTGAWRLFSLTPAGREALAKHESEARA